jgi:hypothetical protein
MHCGEEPWTWSINECSCAMQAGISPRSKLPACASLLRKDELRQVAGHHVLLGVVLQQRMECVEADVVAVRKPGDHPRLDLSPPIVSKIDNTLALKTIRSYCRDLCGTCMAQVTGRLRI